MKRYTLEEMKDFEPSSLIPFYANKYPKREWLETALKNSSIFKWESAAYVRLIDNEKLKLKYLGSYDVDHPDYWIVVLDIVEGNIISGIEFVGNI